MKKEDARGLAEYVHITNELLKRLARETEDRGLYGAQRSISAALAILSNLEESLDV